METLRQLTLRQRGPGKRNTVIDLAKALRPVLCVPTLSTRIQGDSGTIRELSKTRAGESQRLWKLVR